MRWAVINIQTNIVENVIIWDGNGYLSPFSADSLIQLGETEPCAPGYKYDANASIRFYEDIIQENV